MSRPKRQAHSLKRRKAPAPKRAANPQMIKHASAAAGRPSTAGSRAASIAATLPASQLRTLTSDLLARLDLASEAGITFGGNRDLFNALGYKRKLKPKDYRERFERNGIAARVVSAFPKATWRGDISVIEDDDPEVSTQFEIAWKNIEQRLKVYATLSRLDTLVGLGRYAVLLIGAPGALHEPLPATFTADQVAYIQPYSEEDAKITTWEQDTNSERYGLPTAYSLRGSGNTRRFVNNVHYTRVIHVVDGELDEHTYGKPRLQGVWNWFDDLEKITGAGAEAFWRRANQGLWVDFEPEKLAALSEKEVSDMQDTTDEFANSQRRVLATRGGKVQMFGSDVANFSPQVDSLMTLIAGATEIPKRILMGSERGELSSTQDKQNFDTRVTDRRKEYAEPAILRPLIDLLIDSGALPMPVTDLGEGTYRVEWGEIEKLDEDQRANVADKWAGLNAKAGGTVVKPEEIRDIVLGLPPLAPEDRMSAPGAIPGQPTQPGVPQQPAAQQPQQLQPASPAAPPAQTPNQPAQPRVASGKA